MFRISKCANCNKELLIKWGDTMYKLEAEKIKESCKSCGQSLNKKEDYSFCSLKCLKQFVDKLHKGSRLDIKLTKEENAIMTVINYLAVKIGKLVPITDILKEGKGLKFSKREVNRHINELKKYGLIMELRKGFVEII